MFCLSFHLYLFPRRCIINPAHALVAYFKRVQKTPNPAIDRAFWIGRLDWAQKWQPSAIQKHRGHDWLGFLRKGGSEFPLYRWVSSHASFSLFTIFECYNVEIFIAKPRNVNFEKYDRIFFFFFLRRGNNERSSLSREELLPTRQELRLFIQIAKSTFEK